MRRLYTLEIGYLCVVIAVSLVGFSSLVGDEFLGGEQPALTGYHLLHISTSLRGCCCCCSSSSCSVSKASGAIASLGNPFLWRGRCSLPP